MENSANSNPDGSGGSRVARLLIEQRSFEVVVSAPEWPRLTEPAYFPILVDFNNNTHKTEGRRARYLRSAGDLSATDSAASGDASSDAVTADLDAAVALTTRERQVLAELATGASNKAIARTLGISTGTVRVHVKSVLRKLALDNRTQAAVWATAKFKQEEIRPPPNE